MQNNYIHSSWDTYIKNPMKRTNGYFSTYKCLYKIVNIKLCRHFSFVEISPVKRNGTLEKPIYLACVGNTWEDTNKRLANKIMNYITAESSEWIDLGQLSC